MRQSPAAIGASVLVAAAIFLPAGTPSREKPATPVTPPVIDATSLRHKVLCGYQGWFRCPGDAADEGWRHWSRNRAKIAPDTVTFEMWPDLSEYTADEKYPAPGFTYPDGKPAHLFSSAHPKTVDRHFKWMEQYGIDGAFVQRFLVDLKNPSSDQVLGHVRASAAKTGRVYAVCYDLTGAPKGRLEAIAVKPPHEHDRLTDVVEIAFIQGHLLLVHQPLPISD